MPPRLVFSRLVTKYIDDEYGNLETGRKPEFKGDRWIRGGVCEGCIPGGALTPDPSLAFNGTWHYNTRHLEDPVRSVVLNFTGVSIEIFCILPNNPPNLVTATYDLSFMLDGQLVGKFTHSPDLESDFAYNQSVFSKRDLPLGTKPHSMEIKLDSNSTDAALLFDYAKYEIDDGIADIPPTTSSSLPTSPSSASSPGNDSSKERLATILGVIFGTILAIIVCILLVRLRRRRRQPDTSPEPILQPLPFPLVDRKNTPRRKAARDDHSRMGEPSSELPGNHGEDNRRSQNTDGNTVLQSESAPPPYDLVFAPANAMTQAL
ncbi:hypothetical protein Moror_5332 [Moniliophthora roreri MCA 2997]|uniref:Uncharacterized protein n=1 Tax=Moniliophthora roreri (strain MCA 2997) TaxID=1381753 RepID=V2X5H8_MONRO|nr:hypothetical protein Moror_5332 [Moniliophthora roreri MCA 2997]